MFFTQVLPSLSDCISAMNKVRPLSCLGRGRGLSSGWSAWPLFCRHEACVSQILMKDLCRASADGGPASRLHSQAAPAGLDQQAQQAVGRIRAGCGRGTAAGARPHVVIHRVAADVKVVAAWQLSCLSSEVLRMYNSSAGCAHLLLVWVLNVFLVSKSDKIIADDHQKIIVANDANSVTNAF